MTQPTITTAIGGTRSHDVVSHDEWIAARIELLRNEKEFDRLRDELSQRRRDLPWEKVEKNYVFEGPNGKETLAELFGDRNQLVVYHLMFSPAWSEACGSCSFWADNFNGIGVHLRHRDISFLAISRAPLEKLEAYRKRMGWSFKWVSSSESDFNFDYQASHDPAAAKNGTAYYNYDQRRVSEETPGISVFYKDPETGDIYHTYSTYARGIDLVNGAYHYIDLTPKGRDEGERIQSWLKRHDQYQD